MLNTLFSFMGPPLKSKLPLVLVFLVFLVFLSHAAAAEDAEILTRLNSLRKVTPTKDKQELATLNARMDAAWQFLQGHKVEAIPLLTRELAREIEKTQPDQFFMLDVGKLLLSLNTAEAEPLALKTLAKIDPASEIIQYNFQELFEFTYQLAKLGSPKTLSQIDRIFLPNTNQLEFFRAPHHVKLDAGMLCVFLYGVGRTNAEVHLLKILERSSATKQRVLETLCWLGSELSVEPVKKVMASAEDYETLVRALTFMMSLGGPAGKRAVLNLDTAHWDTALWDSKAKEYYERILPAVARTSIETLKAELKQFDDPAHDKVLTNEELKNRLKTMYDNFGVDDETSPSSLTRSTLSRDYLIGQLKAIRSRMFFRLDNHALDDVKITNLIINTLQYMP